MKKYYALFILVLYASAPAADQSSQPPPKVLVELDQKALSAIADQGSLTEDILLVLIGSLLAVGTGLLHYKIQRNWEKTEAAREESDFQKNLKHLLESEAKAVAGIYRNNLGAKLMTVQQGWFTARAQLSVEWFPLFLANGQHLGRLSRDDLNVVLEFHIKAKDLIESFRINNRLLDDLAKSKAGAAAKNELPHQLQRIRDADAAFAAAYKSLTNEELRPPPSVPV
jgi:hypothetical protein